MNTKAYKYIFWDWNGTLIDDADSARLAVNVMLDRRGISPITLEEYRDMIEVPIMNFYDKVMDTKSETIESLATEFNPLCESFLAEYPLFEGTKPILSMLASRGVRQFIFSSSHRKYIEPKLDRFGIENCFESVVGASDVSVGSKAERTRLFIESLGLDKNDILFVGDMVHDHETAEHVGSDCVLVSAGHQCASALRATGREVFDSLSSLYCCLDKIIPEIGVQ